MIMNKVEMYLIKNIKTKTMLLTLMAGIIVSISLTTMISQQAFAQTASSYEYRLRIETYNGQYMQPNRDTRLYVENMDTGYSKEQTFYGGYPPGADFYWYDYQMPVGSGFRVCFGYDDALRPINCEFYIRGNGSGEYVEINLATALNSRTEDNSDDPPVCYQPDIYPDVIEPEICY
jgi:hypothetical protein